MKRKEVMPVSGSITLLVEQDDHTEVINLTECGDEPTLDRSVGSNWVERTGGLPCYVDEIAKDIHDSGHSIGNAIQIAVGQVRNWCHGKGNVTAQTRTKACTASAEWDARKAQAHASHALGEPVDVVVKMTKYGGILLADGDGTPLPLIPDMWAWNAMGVPPMSQSVREKHISKMSDRHTKLTGKHQKTAVPDSMHVNMTECIPCSKEEEKNVISKLDNASPEEKKSLLVRLGELLGLSSEEEVSDAPEEAQASAAEGDAEGSWALSEEVSGEEKAPLEGSGAGQPIRVDLGGIDPVAEPKSILFQLPYEDTELIALADDPEKGEKGKRLYRKVLAQANRVIYHHLGEGGKLDHSKDTLQKMVKNFKEKAFDQVPLLTRHSTPNNKDTDVFAYLGELADLELQGDELVGTFRLTEKGEQVLKDNPKLPTSIGYDPAYQRKNDKKWFGPALQHVATVFRPHLNGLGGWEPVHLSDETEVVDLTAAHYDSDDHGKERDSVSDVVPNPEDKKEEVKTELTETPQDNVVSLEEHNAIKARLAEMERKGRQQGIKSMLARDYAEVPPAKRKAAYVLLSELTEGNSTLINLDEEGEVTLSEDDAQAKAVAELLAGCKENAPDVALGEERGTSQDSDATNSVDAFDEQVTAYAKENNIPWDEAAIRLTEVIN